MEPNDNRYSTDLTSPAKTAVDENCVMAGQIHALSIVLQHQKSRELTAAYRITALENSLARERWYNQQNREIIDDLTARENNNEELIFALRESIAELEEENETAAWTESSLRNEIGRLKEQVDSFNMFCSNSSLSKEIRDLTSYNEHLESQIRRLQTSRPEEKTAEKKGQLLVGWRKITFF